MGILRKYFLYKRVLQVLFGINIFFIITGILGIIQYSKTHEWTSLELFVVGIGTLTFGIVIPTVIIDKLLGTIKEIRRNTEDAVARMVAGWLENYRRSEDPVRDPVFWINVALTTAEALTEKTNHPAGRLISEFAPLIKAELQKPVKKTRAKKE